MKFKLKLISVCVCSSALLLINSCQTFLDIGQNIGSHFSSPEKIKNKIKNPIRDGVKLSVLWIGHASFLIQIYDKVIMLDPLFTNNVAEALRRWSEPGLDLKYLNKLDMILISHSHMDHLSFGSLKEIEEKFPKANLVFPEGAEEYIPDLKFKLNRMKFAQNKPKEYIGEVKVIDSVKITTVAAVHWGGRYGVDGKFWTDKGYSGYIIQYKDVTLYYSCDTAYDEKLFKFIGENFNIDLAIVNIIYCDGCKGINLGSSHIYPMGAVKIMEDVKAKYMIPAHWGLFEDPDKISKTLKKMYYTNERNKEKVKILKIGEQFVLEKQ